MVERTDRPLVLVYGGPSDPYTLRACTMLRMKGVPFSLKPLPDYAAEMRASTGADTGPQLVVRGVPVGGFDALGSLDLRGELDHLLSADRPQDLSTNKR